MLVAQLNNHDRMHVWLSILQAIMIGPLTLFSLTKTILPEYCCASNSEAGLIECFFISSDNIFPKIIVFVNVLSGKL